MTVWEEIKKARELDEAGEARWRAENGPKLREAYTRGFLAYVAVTGHLPGLGDASLTEGNRE